MKEKQYSFKNNIQILLYKESPSLLEKLNLEDDKTFSEPLLFAYFNSKKYNPFPKEVLGELMQGYFITKEPLKIEHSYNKNGTAYIPNIGYFKNGQFVPFEPVIKIEGLEVLKELHPLLNRYLFESYKGNITNQTLNYKWFGKNHTTI